MWGLLWGFRVPLVVLWVGGLRGWGESILSFERWGGGSSWGSVGRGGWGGWGVGGVGGAGGVGGVGGSHGVPLSSKAVWGSYRAPIGLL